MFTAAGIAFDEKELKDFTDITDRETRYYLVFRSKLYDVSDLAKYDTNDAINPHTFMNSLRKI